MANNPNLITDIETGDAVFGGRVAVIHAPKKAKPGELAKLTEFLFEKGLDVFPGHSEDRHILRISNFGNDENLKNLLKVEYPQWDKSRGGSGAAILSTKAAFLKLDLREAEKESLDYKHYLERYATTITGIIAMASAAAYTAGSLLLGPVDENGDDITGFTRKGLSVDWKRTAEFTPSRYFKAIAGGCFFTAAAFLTSISYKNSRMRSMAEIIKEIEPKLVGDTGLKFTEKDRTALADAVQWIQRYPWRVTSITNFIGSTAMAHSTKLRTKAEKEHDKRKDIAAFGADEDGEPLKTGSRQFVEFFSARMGQISQVTSLLAPTDKESVFSGMAEYISNNQKQLAGVLKDVDPHMQQGFGTFTKIAPIFRKYQLLIGGTASMLGNGSMGLIARMEKRGGIAQIVFPFTTACAVAADYFTANSKITNELSLDTIASGAAGYLNNKLPKDATSSEIIGEVHKLAVQLSQQREIHLNPHEINNATLTYLGEVFGRDVPVDSKIALAYRTLSAISPFTKPIAPHMDMPLAQSVKNNTLGFTARLEDKRKPDDVTHTAQIQPRSGKHTELAPAPAEGAYVDAMDQQKGQPQSTHRSA